MNQINGQTYLTEQETARRLGMNVDELFTLMLEGGQPSHIVDEGKTLYLEADIERLRSTVRS